MTGGLSVIDGKVSAHVARNADLTPALAELIAIY
jgi:hypothetical protein